MNEKTSPSLFSRSNFVSWIFFFLCLLSFWLVASTARWFSDWPFNYMIRPFQANNFLQSSLQYLTANEEARILTAWVFITPSILLLVSILLRSKQAALLNSIRTQIVNRESVIVFACCILASLGSFFVSFIILREASLLSDENSYLFQAKLFAQGKLALPEPAHALRHPMIITEGHWTSKYPPGHALLLTPWAAIGIERVWPPMMAAFFVLFIYQFVRDSFSKNQALLASFFAAFSPFVWCVFGTLEVFGTAACLLAASLALLARFIKSPKFITAIGVGATLGGIFITRPYDALTVCIPIGIWVVYRIFKKENNSFLLFSGMFIGFVSIASLLFIHNKLVGGSFLTFPWATKSAFKLGFTQPMPPHRYVHSPRDAVANWLVAAARLDLWLLAFPLSMLLVVIGAVKKAQSSIERLLFFITLSFIFLFTLVFSTGTWDNGPTYYFFITPILFVFAVRGTVAIRDWIQTNLTQYLGADNALLWPIVGVFIGWITIAPTHLIHLFKLGTEINKPWETIAESSIGNSIVIIPRTEQRKAAGHSYGYPYTIANKTGVAKLMQPRSDQEALDGYHYLGKSEPLYVLETKQRHFTLTGERQYNLRMLFKRAPSSLEELKSIAAKPESSITNSLEAPSVPSVQLQPQVQP